MERNVKSNSHICMYVFSNMEQYYKNNNFAPFSPWREKKNDLY